MLMIVIVFCGVTVLCYEAVLDHFSKNLKAGNSVDMLIRQMCLVRDRTACSTSITILS